MPVSRGNFMFVSTDSSGKPDQRQRKRIRSHCMRGKNIRKSEARLIAEASQVDDTLFLSALPSSQSASWRTQPNTDLRRIYSDSVPSPLKSVRFADDIDPSALSLMARIFPGIQRAFSLSWFGLPSDIQSRQWRDWLFSDAGYVHSVIAACSTMQDFLLQRHRSRTTLVQLRKSIVNLNTSLSSTTRSLMDETVALVIALSIAAVISDDDSAMIAHATGLREIIRLRGGVDAFRDNPQLSVVLARIDLCLSLNTGCPPILATLGPVDVPYSLTRHSCARDYPSIQVITLDEVLDGELASIFRDIQYVSRRVNGAKLGNGMQESELHAGIWLAQYRLLRLQGTLQDLTAECIRVAMLAFLTTTFRVLGSRIKYKSVTEQLRNLYCTVEISTERIRRLMFWVLMIGLIAFFDHDEPWLNDKWQDMYPIIEGLQWKDARKLLEGYIWIHVCNDHAGEAAFEQMKQKWPVESVTTLSTRECAIPV